MVIYAIYVIYTSLWMNALWMNGQLISITISDKSVILHITGQEGAIYTCAYNSWTYMVK